MCTVYDRTFGDFPAKNTACTPYIYGYMVLANPRNTIMVLGARPAPMQPGTKGLFDASTI
jgi:hypothetical protein